MGSGKSCFIHQSIRRTKVLVNITAQHTRSTACQQCQAVIFHRRIRQKFVLLNKYNVHVHAKLHVSSRMNPILTWDTDTEIQGRLTPHFVHQIGHDHNWRRSSGERSTYMYTYFALLHMYFALLYMYFALLYMYFALLYMYFALLYILSTPPCLY